MDQVTRFQLRFCVYIYMYYTCVAWLPLHLYTSVYSEWTCTITKQLAYWVLMRAKPAWNSCLAFDLLCTPYFHVQSFIVEFESQFSLSLSSFHSELTGTSEGGKTGPPGGGDYVVSSKWARDRDINLKIRSIYCVYAFICVYVSHMYNVQCQSLLVTHYAHHMHSFAYS